MPSAQAKYCLGGAAKFLEPGNKELRLLLGISPIRQVSVPDRDQTSGALISTSLPKSDSVVVLVNPPSPGDVPVKTYRLIRWSSFPIQYSTRRSSRGSASPISIPGGTNATRWSTSTPSSCSSPTIAKLLRSDGSIGILSKGVSGTESRVSTYWWHQRNEMEHINSIQLFFSRWRDSRVHRNSYSDRVTTDCNCFIIRCEGRTPCRLELTRCLIFAKSD